MLEVNNNRINIGAHCYIRDECSLWIEGNNCIISIGESTTMTCKCHINVQEDNQSIIINRDCMFSNNIIVRTSDSHPIYDNITHQRINNAKSIEIGEHVWVAPNSKIMKGAIIGNGAIIGSDTTISHKIPNNALAVGRPQRSSKPTFHGHAKNYSKINLLTPLNGIIYSAFTNNCIRMYLFREQ